MKIYSKKIAQRNFFGYRKKLLEIFSRKKKSQTWGVDILIAAIVFTLGVIVFYIFVMNFFKPDTDILKELFADGMKITDDLLSEGYPLSWSAEDSDSIRKIGIVSNGHINQTKIIEFYELAQWDYSKSRKIFGTKYDYYMFFDDPIDLCSSICNSGEKRCIGDGNQIWNRTIGGTGYDYGYEITTDSSDNIYVIGRTNSFGAGGSDVWTIKYDSNGNQIWNRTIGGTNGDYGNGITIDSSGSVYVIGTTKSFGAGNTDVWTIKYDSNGNQIWNRTIGGTGSDYGYEITTDSQGFVYVASYTYSFGAGNNDVWIIKYDSNGNQIWNRTAGGTNSDDGVGIATDSQGFVYITGFTQSFGAGNTDVWTIKYDSNGNQIWNRTAGGSSEEQGMSIATDSQGFVYITGYTQSFGAGNTDVWTIKYDSNGNQIWNRTIGGTGSDFGQGIATDSSDNIYVIGRTNSFGAGGSDVWTIKYDSNGNQIWNRTIGGINDDYGSGISIDSTGNVYDAGTTNSFGAGGSDVWTIKLNQDGGNIAQTCADYSSPPDGCTEWGGDNDCKLQGKTCQGGLCVCTHQCEGRECGDNGCGGSCGTCTAGIPCNSNGQCDRNCIHASRWVSMASSSDGEIIFASTTNGIGGGPGVNGVGNLFKSTDSGESWTQLNGISMLSLQSSPDAINLIGGNANECIYASNDSANSWSLKTCLEIHSTDLNYEMDLTLSSNAKKIGAATSFDNYIYFSNDSGKTFIASSSGTGNWSSLVSSPDGTKNLVLGSKGLIFSNDSGKTWVNRNLPPGCSYSLVSSSDLIKLAVTAIQPCDSQIVRSSYIYTSNDSGLSWIQRTFQPELWFLLTSSSDGTKLLASQYGYPYDYLYTSNDSGISWSRKIPGHWDTGTAKWNKAAVSSPDGTKLAVGDYWGDIFTSNDSGENWIRRIVCCTPDCANKQCGHDGCGGSCGTCPSGTSCNSSGQCKGSCSLTCQNLGYECGTQNICGANINCGTCPTGKTCQSGICVGSCIPQCAGKECGPDSCTGSCGTCPISKTCDLNGHCQNNTIILSAGDQSCILLENGSIICWGDDYDGELGDGGPRMYKSYPCSASTANRFKQVSAWRENTCGIMENGSVMCWGDNFYGQIGDGTTYRRFVPAYVNTIYKFKSISPGNHMCGIIENGSAMCWGGNSNGQLGDGTITNRFLPVFVNTSYKFISIETSGYNYLAHTCGIIENGSAMCWGDNSAGQLGDGTEISKRTPIFVNSTYKFIAISIKYMHTCGIIENGSAMCWGGNSNGQLGDGTTTQRKNPVFVNTIYKFKSISTSISFTCGIIENGSAMCWGRGIEGALGNGGSSNQLNPVFVNSTDKFVSIASGFSHTCGIVENGCVKCWGAGYYGGIGDGYFEDRLNPVYANVKGCGSTSFDILKATRIADEDEDEGEEDILYPSESSSFINPVPELNSSIELISSSPPSSSNSALSIKIDGIGLPGVNRTNIISGNYPSDLLKWTRLVTYNGKITNMYLYIWKNTKNYSCSPYTCLPSYCGIMPDGCGGILNCGPCCTESCASKGYECETHSICSSSINCGTCPAGKTCNANGRCIDTTSCGGFKSVSAGMTHACGILINGSAMCWGYGGSCGLGNGKCMDERIPVFVRSIYKFISIAAAGSDHTCGVIENGYGMCWGDDFYGGNGDGGGQRVTSIPVFINTTYKFTSVSAEGDSNCGILQNGSAMCWGQNRYGELGNGNTIDQYSPVFVNTPYKFKSVSIFGYTGYNSCGIIENGSAMCWGNNYYGQLGNGNTARQLNPVFVNSSYKFISIAAGENFACGIIENGSAMCWGNNYYGQLGNGNTARQLNPVFVNSSYKFTSIATGTLSSCGIIENGSAMCWGDNAEGQLGNGNTARQLNPVFVNSSYKFTSIAVGGRFACGIIEDSSAMCWGYNYYGQLGNGETSNRYSPVSVRMDLACPNAQSLTTSQIEQNFEVASIDIRSKDLGTMWNLNSS